MRFSVITLFPEMFSGVFNSSILKRAQLDHKIEIELINLREFGIGSHKTVDDKPYGGGTGMVLRVDVIDQAIQSIKTDTSFVVLLDPKGVVYKQEIAEGLSQKNHLILICGHYEGYDERIRRLVDMEISLGDFVLSGGEIGAMAVVESVARIIPGVLSKSEAVILESFSKHEGQRLLEHAQYTRPESYNGISVPKELLTGHHQKIEEYRKNDAKKITKIRRLDLLEVKP